MKKPGFIYNAYFLLFVILIIAYLPVSSLYFGLKNDAFSDNFPNKLFLTEALRSGFSPIWNPYLNFGFPIYSDPGFSFYSPVTWFFGAVVGYNVYSFTIEILLYIYLAGVFMYRLLTFLKVEKGLAIAVAVMFMCSGFFYGEIQHVNYLTAAAFLPFCIQCLVTLCRQPSLRNAIFSALSYYAVFACGHPAMSLGLAYFMIFLFAGYLLNLKNARVMINRQFLLYHLIAVFIFIGLFLPAIYSLISVKDVYVRSQPLNQAQETGFGFSLRSYISLIFPFATDNNGKFFTDDLSMRNAYFSMAGFFSLFFAFKNKGVLKRSLLIAAIGMLVLSSGGMLKAAIYSTLPGLNFLRTNGEFRVFSICCFCIISGVGLNQMTNFETLRIYLRRFGLFCLIAFCIVAVLTLPNNYRAYKSGPFVLSVDSLSFANAFLISAFFQAILVLFFVKKKFNRVNVIAFIVLDMIVNCFINIPITGVGRTRLSEINAVYHSFPSGIPIPPLQPIRQIDTFDFKGNGLLGSPGLYNKMIGTQKITTYPSMFLSTLDYFKSDLPKQINEQPFIFLKNEIRGHDNPNKSEIKVEAFSPERIRIRITSLQPDTLVFLQNHYPGWNSKIDDHKVDISRVFLTFMAVPIEKGKHNVEFYYVDKRLLYLIIISLGFFLVLLVYLFYSRHHKA